MAATIHFHPLAQVAPAGALTTREWETLARVFGELEAERPHLYVSADCFEHDSRSTRLAEVVRSLDRLGQKVERKVRDALVRAGLPGDQFFVLVAPRIDQSTAAFLAEEWVSERDPKWPDLTWEVVVRLFGSKSDAKRTAEATHVADGPVAPTLAEQHGSAKS